MRFQTREMPAGVDRRAFMMRSAVVGAAAVHHRLLGRRRRRSRPPPPPPLPKPAGHMSADLDVVKKAKGPVMTTIDEFYKVGPGPVEFAHHRPDAHHLRLLPALHQAAGRPARQGHGAEGAPVRQPERHRQGPRHRARRAGRHHRQGAGDHRSAVPRRAARQAGPGLPGEARRQDVRRVAEGHRLRRAEGRLPAPQHDDVQADGRATRCCSSRSTTRSAAGSSSGRATSRRRRGSRSTRTRR